MAKSRRRNHPTSQSWQRRTAIVLLIALTGGLVSGTVMWAAATPPTHAILGGSATAILLFLDKISK